MENKTSTIIIMNVVIFIFYLKFGTMAFWVPAAVGFSLIILFVIITFILELFFIRAYETRFLPALKKLTGSNFFGTTMSDEQRKTIKKGIIPFIFVILLLVGLIWSVIGALGDWFG